MPRVKCEWIYCEDNKDGFCECKDVIVLRANEIETLHGPKIEVLECQNFKKQETKSGGINYITFG